MDSLKEPLILPPVGIGIKFGTRNGYGHYLRLLEMGYPRVYQRHLDAFYGMVAAVSSAAISSLEVTHG